MDWREEYKRRLTAAEEAMKLVQPGSLVMIPIAGPRVLPGALFRHCTEGGVAIDLRLAAPLTDPGWLLGHAETFRVEFELFIGDFARQATDEGRATYLPNLFSLNFKEHDQQRAGAAACRRSPDFSDAAGRAGLRSVRGPPLEQTGVRCDGPGTRSRRSTPGCGRSSVTTRCT